MASKPVPSIALTNTGKSVVAHSIPGGGAVALDPGIGIAASGVTELTSAEVWISSGFLAGDTLAAWPSGGISTSYDAASGVLTLTGLASLAAYQAALDSTVFSSSALLAAGRSLQISWRAFDAANGQTMVKSAAASTYLSVAAITQCQWASPVSGDWNAASGWSPALFPDSKQVTATLGAAGSSSPNPAYTVTLASGPSIVVASLQITDANATLAIGAGHKLDIAGQAASVNDGQIVLDGVGGGVGLLELGSTGTFVNSGLIEATGGAEGANSWVGAQGLGLVANDDMIEALSGALTLSGLTITQSTGALESAAGAKMKFAGTIVSGGQLLQTAPSAPISGFGFKTVAGDSGSQLQSVAIDANLLVTTGSSLGIEGAVAIDDVLQLDPLGGAKLLVDGVASLQGDGELLLGGGASAAVAVNKIKGGQSFAVLDNSVHILASGVGTMAIGGGALLLDNGADGIIEVAAGAALTIDTGAKLIFNDGALIAEGALDVASRLTGSGIVEIAGGKAVLGGAVDAGESVDIAAVSGGPARLHGGELVLGQAEQFLGSIAGLGVGSPGFAGAVDLADFRFANTKITGVGGANGVGQQTELSLKDAIDHLSVTLLLTNAYAGEYSTTDKSLYHLGSDGSANPGALLTVTLAAPS